MDERYDIADGLLGRYLLGEATAAEKEQVEKWVRIKPDNLKQLDDFKALLEASQQDLNLEVDAQQSLEKLNARIHRQANRSVFNFLPVLRWAAILAVIFSMSLFIYNNTIGSSISVTTSERTQVQHLPDGSTATLNKRSSIAYVGGFFNATRQVKLTGEAFFNVIADKKKPFIIDVNNVQVTVVGTAFNVRNEGGETVVSVEEGTVEVASKHKRIRITAGEKVEVNNDRLIKGETLGKLYKFYYSNTLVCDSTPLHQLVDVLNKKFDANIIITNAKIKDLPISTTFENNTLKDILTIVSETLKINVSYEQDVVKLK